MNLANKLTLARIVMIPLFMAVYLLLPNVLPDWYRFLSAAVFLIAAFTDMLDGQVARSRNMVTDFGKFMDALADKMLIFSAFICLSARGELSVWITMLVVFREMTVTSLRMVVNSSTGIVIAANLPGKLKTITQDVAVAAILLEGYIAMALESWLSFTWPKIGGLYPISFISVVLMSVMTVLSGLIYLKAYAPHINGDK